VIYARRTPGRVPSSARVHRRPMRRSAFSHFRRRRVRHAPFACADPDHRALTRSRSRLLRLLAGKGWARRADRDRFLEFLMAAAWVSSASLMVVYTSPLRRHAGPTLGQLTTARLLTSGIAAGGPPPSPETDVILDHSTNRARGGRPSAGSSGCSPADWGLSPLRGRFPQHGVDPRLAGMPHILMRFSLPSRRRQPAAALPRDHHVGHQACFLLGVPELARRRCVSGGRLRVRPGLRHGPGGSSMVELHLSRYLAATCCSASCRVAFATTWLWSRGLTVAAASSSISHDLYAMDRARPGSERPRRSWCSAARASSHRLLVLGSGSAFKGTNILFLTGLSSHSPAPASHPGDVGCSGPADNAAPCLWEPPA